MQKPTDFDRELAAERHRSLSRRRFLRVRACVALPTLPSLLPRWVKAVEVAGSASTEAAAVPHAHGVRPRSFPNGVNFKSGGPKVAEKISNSRRPWSRSPG